LSGATRDIIRSFDFDLDEVDFEPVTTIDAAVNAGTVNNASFDADLAVAVGAGQLSSGGAVLFTANGGDQNGFTFLVVDGNATAGYQAGGDLVIRLINPVNTGSIDPTDFV